MSTNTFTPPVNVNAPIAADSTVSNAQHKAKFLRSILSESSNNKRKFKEAVAEFSLACRGLQNTQYAKETQAHHRY